MAGRGKPSAAGPDRDVLPSRLAPMLATTSPLPADDVDWAYEFKWDGIRAVTYVEGGQARALSRGDKDLTVGFPELGALAAALGAHRAVVDGELVAFDDAGRPSFGRLQRRLNLTSAAAVGRRAEEVEATYLAFDLLHLDGHSLLDLPYLERRARLEALDLAGDGLTTPPVFVDAAGADVLAAAGAGGLEGVVAKRKDSRYRPGERSPDWLKVKIIKTQEVVIGGWTDGEGERAGSLGALLVGVHDESGLRYAGKVGTGFDARTRRDLLGRLDALATPQRPFVDPLGAAESGRAHFVRPELVGEVAFSEWTSAGHLRHPSWRGLRSEKMAREVVREP
ncbi:MAG TPA: non-homologous end-joining DNA ligase [Mycobacteriales bacterium]|nr:non-homologous end-joining DNA ligase [Mycobacteriales bacterium]